MPRRHPFLRVRLNCLHEWRLDFYAGAFGVLRFAMRLKRNPKPTTTSKRTLSAAVRSRCEVHHTQERISFLSRHFPDTEVVGRDLPSLGVARQRNSIAADSLKAKTARCPPRWAETAALCSSRRTLCRRRLSDLTSSPGHAGAGSARSWAIDIRISWNICRGTATGELGRVSLHLVLQLLTLSVVNNSARFAPFCSGSEVARRSALTETCARAPTFLGFSPCRLRRADPLPIVSGSCKKVPPRPRSRTAICSGSRDCRPTTSIMSSISPTVMSN